MDSSKLLSWTHICPPYSIIFNCKQNFSPSYRTNLEVNWAEKKLQRMEPSKLKWAAVVGGRGFNFSLPYAAGIATPPKKSLRHLFFQCSRRYRHMYLFHLVWLVAKNAVASILVHTEYFQIENFLSVPPIGPVVRAGALVIRSFPI